VSILGSSAGELTTRHAVTPKWSPLTLRSAGGQAHKLDAMDFFKGFAVHADELPDAVFTAIGRTVWADIGPTAVIMRLVMKVGSHCLICAVTQLSVNSMLC